MTTDLFDSPDSPAAVLIRDPRRLWGVKHLWRSQVMFLTSLLLAFPVLFLPAPLWAFWLFRGLMLLAGVGSLICYGSYLLQERVPLTYVTLAELADLPDAPKTVGQANTWLRAALRENQ